MKGARSHVIINSEKSLDIAEDTVICDFGHYVNLAFQKLRCPIPVVVETEIRHDPVKSTKSPRNEKRKINKRLTLSTSTSTVAPDSNESKTQTKSAVYFEPVYGQDTLVLKTIYDVLDNVVEVNITKYQFDYIPRVALQILRHVIRYFSTITKITVKQCFIDGYIIHEMNLLLEFSNIVDVCLDGSVVKEGNYDILLDKAKLCNLSLGKCNINDDVCERMFARLGIRKQAGSTLQTLNLSSNRITDKGAKHIGVALRTNRNLRYLNVSDNQLTDEGAEHIFNSLTEFQLTDQENLEQRTCYIKYVKSKLLVSNRSPMSSVNTKKSISKRKAASHKSKMSPIKDKINEIPIDHLNLKPQDIMGDYKHPYGPANVMRYRDRCFCNGNLVLCYLNIAFNNLSYISLKKINKVLLNQQHYASSHCGILMLIVIGNYFPENCKEMETLHNLLLKKRNQISNISADRRKSMSSDRRRPLK